jgi:hypothetical protein
MPGTHFWGCKCCGTYDRQNELVQTTMAYFKSEWNFSGSTSSEPESVTLWTATMLASLRKARESTWMVRSGGAPSLSKELPST